jgi:uncharacterized UPF0160 family protein
MIIMPA